MKFIPTLLLFISTSLFLNAQQHDGMYVAGKILYDACGDPVTMKGVNYAVLDDWDFPATSEKSAEIEKSGSNTVRIQWYINYGNPGRPAYSLADLDTVISRVAALDMVPVVEIHDYTCAGDLSVLANTITPWWTQPSVVALVNKHKKYIIINIANEFGQVRYLGGNPATHETNFKNAYNTSVTSIRNAGIHVPIMIDAPDCGTTLSTFINVGNDILSNDPDRNIIFSVHTYWFGYTGNDSLAIRNELMTAVNSPLCIVLGEVATQQDEVNQPCAYNLNWTPFLHIAEEHQIGWLIWGWYKDQCPGRAMTTDGNFNNLTAFGNQVVYHPVYGLQNVSERSEYLISNGACNLSVDENDAANLRMYFAGESLFLHPDMNLSAAKIIVNDMAGRIVSQTYLAQMVAGENYGIDLSGKAPGAYVISIYASERNVRAKFVKP